MLTITSSLIILFGDQNPFISSMWKETIAALLTFATLLEKPTRRIVDESTHLVALCALAFQVEFENYFGISGLLTFP